MSTDRMLSAADGGAEVERAGRRCRRARADEVDDARDAVVDGLDEPVASTSAGVPAEPGLTRGAPSSVRR